MFRKELKYSYNDIAIMPAKVSYINSRKEVEIPIPLPIFTAPMSTVVSEGNFQEYKNTNITPILPRNIAQEIRLQYLKEQKGWVALSLAEFSSWFSNPSLDRSLHYNVCVDVANGHMYQLLDKIRSAKYFYPNLVVMAGNIANPDTIVEYSLAGIDYVRVGIGAGAGCITTSNTGVHYPIASLIDEIYAIQEAYTKNRKDYKKVKIVADGGIRNYSDVIKALALGADAVMIGSLFAQCEEGCGKTIEKDGRKYHQFYGMASSEGQKDLIGEKTKTSEGICKEVEVKYTLRQWVTNMEDYLRSAMSYCNAKSLEQFIGQPMCVLISNNTKQSLNQ